MESRNYKREQLQQVKADCPCTALNDVRKNINILSYGLEYELKHRTREGIGNGQSSPITGNTVKEYSANKGLGLFNLYPANVGYIVSC
jgi:hypothetical protein